MLPVFALLVSAAVTTAPATPRGAPEYPHVRAVEPRVAEIIQDGIRRSATFARLYRSLQQTDVILFVQTSRDLPRALVGGLSLITSTPLARYLRADIRADLPRWDMIATIAHEMQHALEIAGAYEVRDAPGVNALYRRIGRAQGAHVLETDVAYRVGLQVRAEMLA
ncbi:MAG TPA: hypothetical protein VK886_07260 [Vicinamibacterales bacterium]|nr:hypothetical protein [Vicinamibacterales bacterium]